MYYVPEECGARVRSLRQSAGLTQNQLAERLHISSDHLRAIENGRRGPSIDLMVELAELFGVSLDYLILGRSRSFDQMQQRLRKTISELQALEKGLNAGNRD